MAAPTQADIDAWHARTRQAPGLLSPLGALSDMFTAAGRGVAKTTLGWPGDIERALTPASETRYAFPSSSDVGDALPAATHFSMPAGTNPYETLGSYAPLSPSQLGKMGAAAGKSGLAVLHEGLQGEGALAGLVSPAAAGTAYAVKPKGGNFNAENAQKYLANLGADRAPLPAAVNDWAGSTLKNYLTKQVGSPADPLLKLEQQYPDLHFPSGDDLNNARNTVPYLGVEAAQTKLPGFEDLPASRQGRYQKAYDTLATHDALNGGAGLVNRWGETPPSDLTPGMPLTPWGWHSGESLKPQSIADTVRFHQLYNTETPLPDWMLNAPADAKQWSVRYPGEDELGFGHVLDYLHATQNPEHQFAQELQNHGLGLTPDQIANTSVAQAVEKTAKWNALQKQLERADPMLGVVDVPKTYENGQRWVQLGMKPGTLEGQIDPDFQKAVAAESDALSHSVRGYGDATQPNYGLGGPEAARTGKAKVYSLRDKDNNPLATVEVHSQPGDWASSVIQNPDENAQRAFLDEFSNRVDAAGLNKMAEEHPGVQQIGRDLYAQQFGPLPPTESITQIKGLKNGVPSDEALPAIHDFVQSGNWGSVSDSFHNLKDYGLHDTTVQSGHYGLMDDLKGNPYRFSNDDAHDLVSAYRSGYPPPPRYATQDDVIDYGIQNPDAHGVNLGGHLPSWSLEGTPSEHMIPPRGPNDYDPAIDGQPPAAPDVDQFASGGRVSSYSKKVQLLKRLKASLQAAHG